MSRLKSLKPLVARASTRQLGDANRSVEGIGERKLVGATRQRTRLRLWKLDPYCAGCGRLLDYPRGFELDHITPLHLNGGDEDTNLQLLCVDDTNPANGCHAKKTLQEDKDRTGDRRR